MRAEGWQARTRSEGDGVGRRGARARGGTINRPSFGAGLSGSMRDGTRKMVNYA